MKTLVTAFLIALAASFVGTPDAEAIPACKAGYEKSGALCYPTCRAGYYGVGPVCWQRCPGGFNDDGLTCRKNPDIQRKPSYGRGVGSPLSSCSGGYERNGALCYPRCRSGFKGVGPVCWQQCPGGYPDHGAFCGKPKPYGRGGGYPWKFGDGFNLNGATARCERAHGRGRCEKNGLLIYPKCRAGFHPAGCCICSPNCVAGMRDIGVSCAKQSYGRGAGKPMGCAPGTEQNGALCYPRCRSGYRGLGPVCWGNCPAGYKDDGATCRKDANILWKKSYGRGAGYPLETVKKFFKDVGEKIKAGFEKFAKIMKEKVIDKIKSFAIMLYNKVKDKVVTLVSNVIISLSSKIGFTEADIKAIVDPRTGKYNREALQKVVINKLLKQYLQPIIKDKLLLLIDKGLELIQKFLDAGVAVVIGGLGSIPFVGGAIAAAVNIAWSYGMKALRSFAASKLSQLATDKVMAPLINLGISALYKLGGPVKFVVDKLLESSARFFDRWVVLPGSAAAKPAAAAPRAVLRVAPRSAPRVAPRPAPRVAPRPAPRVAARPPAPPVARRPVLKPAPRAPAPPVVRRPVLKPAPRAPAPAVVQRPVLKPAPRAPALRPRPVAVPPSIGARASAARRGTITVVSGTYGRSCRKPTGNATAHLARSCDGRSTCSYRVDHRVIGDPAPGCAKDYVAAWRCVGEPAPSSASLPREASGRTLRLACNGGSAASTPEVGVATVRKQFADLYRSLGRARRSGLLAARTLGVMAATNKNRNQALRAVGLFRRALQGAFRLAHAAWGRTRGKLQSLAESAAAPVAAALSKAGAVNVGATASGPAAKAFDQAKAALVETARAGVPLIGGGAAVGTGRTQKLLGGMVTRFERLAAQGASALDALARALR